MGLIVQDFFFNNIHTVLLLGIVTIKLYPGIDNGIYLDIMGDHKCCSAFKLCIVNKLSFIVTNVTLY